MQSEEEMQRTLAHLRDAWGVDVSPAQDLKGEELWSWMQLVGSELIEREYAKNEGQNVSRIVNDPVHRNKQWWIR
jgi:hypothetical protein